MIIQYDAAGNRILRGTPCDPECSVKVENTDDNGNGSLRKAVFCATNGDIVWFSPDLMNGVISLTSGSIEIDKNIQINTHFVPINILGPSAPEIVDVMSTTDDILFDIKPNAQVTIHGLNMKANQAYEGYPSILINEGHLTLKDLNMILDGNLLQQTSAIYNIGIIDIIGIVKLLYEN